MDKQIEVGKTYEINHSRKGIFSGTIVADHDGLIDVVITDGKATYSIVNPDAYKGEMITVRTSFCTFKELG